MSYSLEPQLKKSKSFSKYLYSNLGNEEDFYLFDIKFNSEKKKSKKIRKVKNSKNDILINLNDNIQASKYSSLEMNIVNISNPSINHSLIISLKNDPVIYQDEFVYLEISTELKLLKCFYNLEVI